MATRLPSLLDPALLFAHRGARTAARAHTIDAMAVALRLGATGIHVDVRSTRDGHVVCSRERHVRRFPRRRFADTDLADLPEWVVAFDDLYEIVGPGTPIGVAAQDPAAGAAVIAAARVHGAEASTWLGHGDLDVLAAWRDEAPGIRLVNTTTLESLPLGPERRAAELAAGRIDAVSLPEGAWSGGLTTLFHRFEVLAFATGAHYERQLVRLIDMGVDAVVGDHADRMAAVASTFE